MSTKLTGKLLKAVFEKQPCLFVASFLKRFVSLKLSILLFSPIMLL